MSEDMNRLEAISKTYQTTMTFASTDGGLKVFVFSDNQENVLEVITKINTYIKSRKC